MNLLAIKGIGLILVIALLVGLGYHRGSSSAMREFLPQLEALKAVIEASDARAQEIVEIQEKNHDQIAESHSNNVARVVQFYDRMLREAREADSGPVTFNPCQPDDPITAPSSTEVGCSIEFEQQCVLTALMVDQFQKWALGNQIPVQ